MILETVHVGQLGVNCYILAEKSDGEAIIIDPGDEEQKIRLTLKEHGLKPSLVINTHGHYDHIGCDDAFGVKVYIFASEEPLLRNGRLNFSALFAAPVKVNAPAKLLEDKEMITLGSLELEVIHTPGHTPGGICLLLKKPQDNILFTGDTLFLGGVGRTDFPGANGKQLIKSIRERLMTLADDTVCYPGHGSPTTIGEERANNPFLS